MLVWLLIGSSAAKAAIDLPPNVTGVHWDCVAPAIFYTGVAVVARDITSPDDCIDLNLPHLKTYYGTDEITYVKVSYQHAFSPPAYSCVNDPDFVTFVCRSYIYVVYFTYHVVTDCCYGDFGTGWALAFVPETNAIKITRADGSSESGSRLDSIESMDAQSSASGKAAAQLLARVYDQNGQVVPNVNVQLTVDVTENSGGHQHNNKRNTDQMGLLASPQGTVSQNGKVLTGTTGADGLAFSFTAPAAAGDHTIKARCTDRTCTQQGPDQVWVGVKGLIPIPPLPDLLPQATYQLYEANGKPIGQTDGHPQNHFLAADAILKLWNLGFRYSMVEFPDYPLLHINDASLERGGLFDLSGNWHHRPNGHHEHRRGSVVDIRANGGPGSIPVDSAVHRTFEKLALRLGVDAEIHGDGDNQHYHVRLRGIRE